MVKRKSSGTRKTLHNSRVSCFIFCPCKLQKRDSTKWQRNGRKSVMSPEQAHYIRSGDYFGNRKNGRAIGFPACEACHNNALKGGNTSDTFHHLLANHQTLCTKNGKYTVSGLNYADVFLTYH